MMMDIEKIKQYMPHRYPFIMLDRVLDAEPGKSIVGIKNISINEPIFQGHFPNKAIFPGVLIVEAMAQLSGVLAYLTAGVEPDAATQELYFFAGIDKVRFKKMVVPGDQLKLTIEFLQEKGNYSVIKTKGIATVDDELVCTAELLIAKKREGVSDD
jgi:3-hydroxyacyl-[acyl-carrier-protein] dehydratase